LWDLESGYLSSTIHTHQQQVNAISFTESGDFFSSGGNDNLVFVWSADFSHSHVDPHADDYSMVGGISTATVNAKINEHYMNVSNLGIGRYGKIRGPTLNEQVKDKLFDISERGIP
ncbi:MAG: hypothetical protein EZS28_055189, partial [Streblomastix strix]